VSPRLVLVGLSHHTAPIAVREKVAVPEGALDSALEDVSRVAPLDEVLVVSTCNRVEVYGSTTAEPAAAARAVRDFLSSRDPTVDAHLYEHHDVEALRHLFRVCSSLDSMVVGEPQILGQVKDAYGAADRSGKLKTVLGRAARRGFQVAKRVRTETAIGRAAVSMSYAAVELGKKILGSLEGRTVLLVGAGKMSTLAARHLASAGCSKILVTNRSPQRAETLAAEIGGIPRPWSELATLLAEADVCICSTAAPHPVITAELVLGARKVRKHRPLFFVDLAVPRDVAQDVNQLDDVYVYDVDDLDQVVGENRHTREDEAAKAEAIVAAEAQAFLVAARNEAGPILRELRVRGEEIARAEAERTLAKLGASLADAQRRSVEAMARAIVNKILHAPTARIRAAAEADDGRILDAALEIFELRNHVAEPAEGEGDNVLQLPARSESGS
jgi:glutamyl-tRNA reductase